MTIRACGHISTSYDSGRCLVCDRTARDRRRHKDGSTPKPKPNRVTGPVASGGDRPAPVNPTTGSIPHPPPAFREPTVPASRGGMTKHSPAKTSEPVRKRLCASCGEEIRAGETMVPASGWGADTRWAHRACKAGNSG